MVRTKVSGQVSLAGALGALAGALAGAVVVALVAGVLGLAWGAVEGFGIGFVLGWNAWTPVGAVLGAMLGGGAVLVRSEGELSRDDAPLLVFAAIAAAAVGYVVVGVIGAFVVGAQYAVEHAVETSLAWAQVSYPWGALAGLVVGAAVGVKLQLDLAAS